VLSSCLQGAIQSLIVKDMLTGSNDFTESFGVMAKSTIGLVKIDGHTINLPWELGNIVIVENL